MSKAGVTAWLEELKADLYGRILPFWLQHSVDGEHGGFFNNLEEDGTVYDTQKHVWLQGRQCWMFAKIANTHTEEQLDALAARYAQPLQPSVHAHKAKAAGTPTPLKRSELIRVARAGVQFLRDHAVNKANGHVYFSLARDGAPASAQRKPFSAMFMIMALNEVSKATGEKELRAEALDLMDRVLEWVRTPGALGREPLPGAPALEPMSVPMMVLNVVGELTSGLPKEQADALFFAERRWAVENIKKHFVKDRKIVRSHSFASLYGVARVLFAFDCSRVWGCGLWLPLCRGIHFHA